MANVVVANMGCFVAGLLSLFWVLMLCRPWTFIWTNNDIVEFKVTLLRVKVEKGHTGHVGYSAVHAVDDLLSTQFAQSLTELLDQDLLMEDAVHYLCVDGVDSVWQWCNTWVMVKYASIIFAWLGIFAVLFLCTGGAFMYYYAHYRPTDNGRIWTKVCFIAAPCCAWLGLLQYVVLTFPLGKGQRELTGVGETRSTYGPGFVFATVLTFLTVAPIYIQGVFSKCDYEKEGVTDIFLEDGNSAAPRYGSAEAAGCDTSTPQART